MHNWDQATLGEIVAFQNGDRSSNYPSARDNDPTGPLFVSASEVGPNGLNESGARRISQVAFDRLRAGKFRRGDLLYCLRGTIGKIARVETDSEGAIASSLVILRSDEQTLLEYVYYFLSSPLGQSAAISLNNGSAQPNLSVRSLSQLSLPVPPTETLTSIVSVLRALDDKIDLNRRMNETLEAQARALFRDWFMDFGPVKAKMAGAAAYLAPDLWSLFPDRLGNDGVPNGWVVYNVCDLAEHHTAALNPQSFPDEEFEHFSLPAFDSGKDPTIEQGSNIKSNKTIVPDQAVLLSKLNPEIARVWWPASSDGRRQIASTEFLAFVPKDGASRSLIYSLLSAPQFRQRLEGMVTGTSKSHQRVSPKALSALEAFPGEPDVMRAFASIVDPLMDKVVQNRIESAILAHTRDLLLPKLMSGDIRVGDVERELEPA